MTHFDPNKPWILARNVVLALVAVMTAFVAISNFYQQPKALAAAVEVQNQRITAHDVVLQAHTTELAVNAEQFNTIHDDLKDIKRDMKTLLLNHK